LDAHEVSVCLQKAQEGEFILFENIRNANKTGMSEKLNDVQLAEYLKGFVDFYIQDAFAVSHRKHTSVSALPELFDTDHKVAGYQLSKEVSMLLTAVDPVTPLVTILSGAKFSTKLPLIEKYIDSANVVFVGGALYNNVLKSLGYNVGSSLIDTEAGYVDKLVQKEAFTEKVYIPKHVIVQDIKNKNIRESDIKSIDINESIMDIASQSVIDFVNHIASIDAKTIVWNGPIGNFENHPFQEGTELLVREILKYIHNSVLQDVHLVIGGGDTTSALKDIEGLSSNPNVYISTGGGAMLEFLEKEGELPGIMSLF
jgi:phosphoglycerate kinase